MKVLFCTPFLTEEGIVLSGIGIWANNILDYYSSTNDDIELVPISFDRRYCVSTKSTKLERIIYGLRDYWKPIYSTKKYLQKNSVDVLHLCSSAQLSLYKDLLLIKMAKRLNVKTVIHFHFGRIPELLQQNNHESRMILRVCKSADKVIVMDLPSYKTLKLNGFLNVEYLPNPLSVEIMKEVKRLEGKVVRDENRVLFVGHIIPKKGISELVKACCLVDNVELHLVGTISQDYLQELCGIAKAREGGEWLKYRGRLTHMDVIAEMLASGIFCLPSYTEGFPNVILESMACGCSIVATPVGAVPEMLMLNDSNLCGLEVRVNSVDDIVVQLKLFLEDVDLRDACRQNAFERVSSQYLVPIVWEKLVSIWKSEKSRV